MAVGKRLLFSLVVLLIVFGLAEIGARLTWEPPAIREQGTSMVPHPTRIWALPPGEQQSFGGRCLINDDGMRVSRVKGLRYRALTTGDSSIFGHGLNDGDTLHDAVAAALMARGIPTDVYCGGVPGYSTEQTLVLLEESAWALEPDLLVIGNLWSDNGVRFFSDREWMEQLRSPTFNFEYLLKSSVFWRFLRYKIAPPAQETLPVGWVRDPYATGRRRVELNDYAQNLDTMLLQAAERGVSAVMLSPCNRDLAVFGETKASVWDPYFRAMDEVAARRGVPYVAGCDVVQGNGLYGDDAFLDEMHPTALVNRLYGVAIAAAVTERGWPFQPVIPDASLPLFDRELTDDWDQETQQPFIPEHQYPWPRRRYIAPEAGGPPG